MTTEDTAKAARWDLFIEACRKEGVPEKRVRWYVVRIERYARAHVGKSVKKHGPDEVRGYLEEAGRDPSTPGWLFRQWVHALQILHSEVIGAE